MRTLDVTAGLYGGHHERKLKVRSIVWYHAPRSQADVDFILYIHQHLNRQKEGKKQMKRIGNIELPQAAFFDILSTKSDK